ncbi:Pycsar system effector family protein [Granulicella cerasi]|uniref:Pycsar system effector family protein n=1 Tax=Granulicella cerasi TaxID=741063 RepID=A0ABW1Z8M9_9BACT|nr:Pycsar system effector family protein [Granulicella cerasi]
MSVLQGAAPPSPPTLDDAAKQAFLWHVHDYLGEYARFADTKAAFAGTLAGGVLGALYGGGLFLPLFAASYRSWTTISWLTAGAGIVLATVIGLAISTVYPRLRSAGDQGFIFWRNIIAFKDATTFRTSFDSQSAHTLNEHLLNQNFAIAKHVCTPKYRKISVCLLLLGIGVALAAGAFLLKERPSPIGCKSCTTGLVRDQH